MLGIVILNYKEWQLTIDCVKSIRDTIGDIKYKIYIVEGGSGNDSEEKLTQAFGGDEDVKFVILKENRGFSYGNNRGAERAIADGCTELLITNSDVIFRDNSIQEMINTLATEEKCALVAPLVYNRDGISLQTTDIQVKHANWLKMFISESRAKELSFFASVKKSIFKEIEAVKDTTEIFWFSGCCFIVDSKSFEGVGMFDEEIFLYYEEAILSEKFNEKQFKMMFEPKSQIIHLWRGSSGSIKDVQMRLIAVKSRIVFYSKYKKIPHIIMRFLVYLMLLLIKGRSLSWDEFKNQNKKNLLDISETLKNYG